MTPFEVNPVFMLIISAQFATRVIFGRFYRGQNVSHDSNHQTQSPTIKAHSRSDPEQLAGDEHMQLQEASILPPLDARQGSVYGPLNRKILSLIMLSQYLTVLLKLFFLSLNCFGQQPTSSLLKDVCHSIRFSIANGSSISETGLHHCHIVTKQSGSGRTNDVLTLESEYEGLLCHDREGDYQKRLEGVYRVQKRYPKGNPLNSRGGTSHVPHSMVARTITAPLIELSVV